MGDEVQRESGCAGGRACGRYWTCRGCERRFGLCFGAEGAAGDAHLMPVVLKRAATNGSLELAFLEGSGARPRVAWARANVCVAPRGPMRGRKASAGSCRFSLRVEIAPSSTAHMHAWRAEPSAFADERRRRRPNIDWVDRRSLEVSLARAIRNFAGRKLAGRRAAMGHGVDMRARGVHPGHVLANMAVGSSSVSGGRARLEGRARRDHTHSQRSHRSSIRGIQHAG